MTAQRFDARFTTLDALIAEQEGWAALAHAALEPNPFYEQRFLTASIRHLEPAGAVQFLAIHDRAHNNRLAGLFPLRRPRWREGILFGAISLYRNAYSSLTTPLIRSDDAEAVLGAAFESLAANEAIPKVLHFGLTGTNRAFGKLLVEYARDKGLQLVETGKFQRAAIETDLDFDAYQQLQSPGTRKNLARKQRQLAANGALSFTTIIDDAALPAALQEFLALEKKGWKGRRGTALANHARTRAFAEAAFGRGDMPRLVIERLSLDGKPLAMNLNLVSSRAAFTVKTAYDEDFAAFSPGALLDRQTARLATSGGLFDRIDSCAGPGHRIEAIWRERETISTLLVGTLAAVPATALARIGARMHFSGRLIAGAKALRDRFSR